VKEVAQLRKDHELEVRSLAEKYSQDIATLERQMATKTTQHEVSCKCSSVMCYLGLLFYCHYLFLKFFLQACVLCLCESHKMSTLMASHILSVNTFLSHFNPCHIPHLFV
jgi:hypothetical protein